MEMKSLTRTFICLVSFMMLLSYFRPTYSQTDNLRLAGIERYESLSDDGSTLKRYVYKWYAGFGEDNVESVAIEMALKDAYARHSRIFIEAAIIYAETGTDATGYGNVEKLLESCWKQVYDSVSQVCETMYTPQSTYNEELGKYKVWVKVGFRGDKFREFVDWVAKIKPEGITSNDLQTFIEVNNLIKEIPIVN